jgi:hypothetical protein
MTQTDTHTFARLGRNGRPLAITGNNGPFHYLLLVETAASGCALFTFMMISPISRKNRVDGFFDEGLRFIGFPVA